jgi:hypothetical protein
MAHTDQWLRKIRLFVLPPPSSPLNQGIDLSEMRIEFRVNAADVETPNTAIIRVYNLSEATATQVAGEFDRVILEAGYEDGNFGTIFQGTIKQFRRGRVSRTDKVAGTEFRGQNT